MAVAWFFLYCSSAAATLSALAFFRAAAFCCSCFCPASSVISLTISSSSALKIVVCTRLPFFATDGSVNASSLYRPLTRITALNSATELKASTIESTTHSALNHLLSLTLFHFVSKSIHHL